MRDRLLAQAITAPAWKLAPKITDAVVAGVRFS
jgi:hypothetical protein